MIGSGRAGQRTAVAYTKAWIGYLRAIGSRGTGTGHDPGTTRTFRRQACPGRNRPHWRWGASTPAVARPGLPALGGGEEPADWIVQALELSPYDAELTRGIGQLCADLTKQWLERLADKTGRRSRGTSPISTTSCCWRLGCPETPRSSRPCIPITPARSPLPCLPPIPGVAPDSCGAPCAASRRIPG